MKLKLIQIRFLNRLFLLFFLWSSLKLVCLRINFIGINTILVVKKFKLHRKVLREGERDLIIAFGCRFQRARKLLPGNSDGALNSRQTCTRTKQWETIEIVCDTHVDRPGIYDAFRGLCSNATKTLQVPRAGIITAQALTAWKLPVLNIYNVFPKLNIFAIQSSQ